MSYGSCRKGLMVRETRNRLLTSGNIMARTRIQEEFIMKRHEEIFRGSRFPRIETPGKKKRLGLKRQASKELWSSRKNSSKQIKGKQPIPTIRHQYST